MKKYLLPMAMLAFLVTGCGDEKTATTTTAPATTPAKTETPTITIPSKIEEKPKAEIGQAPPAMVTQALTQQGMAAMSGMEASAQASMDPEKIYKGLCFSCHDLGVAGAPKLGDKAAWDARIATGMDALYKSSLTGKNAMPAKGGNPALTEEEVKATVDFMVAKAK